MTFPKWRNYGYKTLESQHKRRNTISAVRSSKRRRPQLFPRTASLSPDRDDADDTVHPDFRDSTEAETLADNGAAGREHVPPTDTTEADTGSSTEPILRRNRTFSMGSGWTSLRNRLSSLRRRNGSRQLRSSVSPSPPPPPKEDDEEMKDAITKTVPETDQELEHQLQDAWSSVFTVGEARYGGFMRKKQALEYSRKMAELRHQYQLKLAEICQREATFLQELLSHDESTPLLLADQLTIPRELKRAIHEAQSSGKFDKLRMELKQETVAAVLALQSRYPTVVVRRKRGLSERKVRPLSCQWPSRTVVYCNPHADQVAQSGSMVGIFDGFYATENFCDELHHIEHESRLENSL